MRLVDWFLGRGDYGGGELRCTECDSSLRLASRSPNGYRCLTCNADTPGYREGSEAEPDGAVVVRTYRAGSPEKAAVVMQADAVELASDGYFPVSQSWAQGQWGCGAYLFGVALILLFGIGLLVLLYLLVVHPDGTLTVTYQLREVEPTAAQSSGIEVGPTKVCPDCAETVQAAARICRYCRHQF